jgi:hypothetical protein
MTASFLVWTSRVLGLLVCLFLAAFALDSVDEGIGAFVLHLRPAALLLLVVLVSWRWPWIGAGVFFAAAALYAVTMQERPTWVLWISGPLLATGILYFASWRAVRTAR